MFNTTRVESARETKTENFYKDGLKTYRRNTLRQIIVKCIHPISKKLAVLRTILSAGVLAVLLACVDMAARIVWTFATIQAAADVMKRRNIVTVYLGA
ncbi:MAG: hypothetical protein CHKLHMKO_00145 [Candidatus Argoarchaeum ethanivorans]|uniref:Uncharacterized protein n=1 Tax=Candidatus Argoarchaeum ethanivorans TaxID=2608793 RepID=A0A811TAE5_9EURY|nr:MAG: hypothetical protein CHKLHMKO_00145 [Candidatus Argoarchaeum ethanivorans]